MTKFIIKSTLVFSLALLIGCEEGTLFEDSFSSVTISSIQVLDYNENYIDDTLFEGDPDIYISIYKGSSYVGKTETNQGLSSWVLNGGILPLTITDSNFNSSYQFLLKDDDPDADDSIGGFENVYFSEHEGESSIELIGGGNHFVLNLTWEN